jgi:hypothetical protein
LLLPLPRPHQAAVAEAAPNARVRSCWVAAKLWAGLRLALRLRPAICRRGLQVLARSLRALRPCCTEWRSPWQPGRSLSQSFNVVLAKFDVDWGKIRDWIQSGRAYCSTSCEHALLANRSTTSLPSLPAWPAILRSKASEVGRRAHKGNGRSLTR